MEIRSILRPTGAAAAARPTAPVDPASSAAEDLLLPGSPEPLARGPLFRSLTSCAASSSERLSEAARLVENAGVLRKHENDYRLRAWSQGGDGTLYAAYTDRQSGTRSYLAAVAPSGEILWERPIEGGPIRHLAGLDEGVLLWTRDSRICCDLQGHDLGAVEAPPDMADLWRDGAGCRYHTEGSGRRLRAETADSRPVALPPDLAEAEVVSARPTPDGGLLVRTRDRLVQLAPGGGLVHSTPLPTWAAEGDDRYAVLNARSMPGGDLLVTRQKKNMYFPRHPPGRHFPPMYYMRHDFDALYMDPIVTTSEALVRLSPDGKERWQTEFLGNDLSPVVTGDGQVLFRSRRSEDGDRAVLRVLPDGGTAPAFQADQPIQDLQALAGGLLLVRHAEGATVRTPEGEVKGRVDLAGEARERRFEGQDRDGRLLFWDDRSRELWACDAPSGAWTRLTDPLGDHSLALVMAERQAAPGELPRLEEGEEWVLIGGVRLPVQSRAVN